MNENYTYQKPVNFYILSFLLDISDNHPGASIAYETCGNKKD